jgi:hypothetical protein
VEPAASERACEHCGSLFTGRADKRYCRDACRNAANRSRSDRSQTAGTDSAVTWGNSASRSDPIRSGRAANGRLSRPVLSAARDGLALAWDPPSEPRTVTGTGERCPGCDRPLMMSPRGTLRGCAACKTAVPPRGVRAPYERGPGQGRQARTRHERDLDGIELARRKAAVHRQLSLMAADDQLDTGSRAAVDYCLGELREATSLGRVNELVALILSPEAGIRGGPAPGPALVVPGQVVSSGPAPGDGEAWCDEDIAEARAWLAEQGRRELARLRGATAPVRPPPAHHAAMPLAALAAPANAGESGRLGEQVAGHASVWYRPCEDCRERRRWGPDGRWPAAVLVAETGDPPPGRRELCDRCWQDRQVLDPRAWVVTERYRFQEATA